MSTSPKTFLFWGQPEEEWNIDKTTEYTLCIHNTVTEIGIGEFSFKDYNFTSLIFQSPSAVKIHPFAFSECYQLTRIHFPEGLEEIPYRFFNDCKSLTDIHFPSTLKSIGEDCFKRCRNLRNDLQLPNSLEVIRDCAFNTTWEKFHNLPLGLLHLGNWPFGFNSTGCLDLTHQIFDLLKHPSYCLISLSLSQHFRYHLSDEERDDEVELLVNAMDINNTLIGLDLSYNQLKEHHVKKIMAILYKCPSLRFLNLEKNAFTSMNAFDVTEEQKNEKKHQSRLRRLQLDVRKSSFDNSARVDLEPLRALATNNPELHCFGGYIELDDHLKNLLYLNEVGRVLIDGNSVVNKDIPMSVWAKVLGRIDDLDIGFEESKVFAPNIAYYFLSECLYLLPCFKAESDIS